MNKLRSFLMPLVVLVLVAQSAYGAFYQWSKTAGSNATADPSINWAEGMAPSAVNDSARAMMARLKEWGDDISGMLAAGGTSTAYTVTTNQGLTSTPSDGTVICFTPGTTNAVAVTLAADGGTAFPIRTDASNGVPGASLIAGSPYCAIFRTASSGWIVRQFFGNPFNVPLGAVLDYTGDTLPNSNFLIANGACISRSSFAAYFALVGTRFSACDGVTTFGIPDLRGRITPGTDTLGGSAANRMTNSANGCGVVFQNVGVTCGSESQTLSIAQMPAHDHGAVTGTAGAHTHTVGIDTANDTGGPGALPRATGSAGTDVFLPTSSDGNHTHSVSSQGGGGAHPIVQPSMAMNKIVRVF